MLYHIAHSHTFYQYSNLNRQFLFRYNIAKNSEIYFLELLMLKDPKLPLQLSLSTSAKKTTNKKLVVTLFRRIPGAKVVPHVCMLQSKSAAFYKQFKLVISGLDSVPARRLYLTRRSSPTKFRWLNAMLCSLVVRDDADNIDPFTVIPLIDGGTEGFKGCFFCCKVVTLKGHARVILPYITACFECAIDAFPPQVAFFLHGY